MKNKNKLMLIVCLVLMVAGCMCLQAYQKGYIISNNDEEAVSNIRNATSSAITVTVKPTAKATHKAASKSKKNKTTSDSGTPIDVPDNIKVLISTTDFGSLYHNAVQITSSQSFYVTVGGKRTDYRAGRKVTFKLSNKKLKGKSITALSANGARIKITSITRQNIHPQYRGTLQIKWKKKGFLVTNILPLEQYLYAVVPSEMSTGNKMEALKAQAVCARSYAYNQIMAGRYKQYNADLNDSVSCQVYNNIPEDSRSRKAVDTTQNKVMTSSHRIVTAYYFSTSWGCTADGQDVWNTTSSVPYLKSKLQITAKSRRANGISQIDLSADSTFRNFIDNNVCTTYDSDEAWYRWSVTLKSSTLSKRINSALYSCYASNHKNVLTRLKNGTYKSRSPKSIGKIKSITIEKRETSGLVSEIVITGSKRTVKVCNQYNVRLVLAPVSEKLTLRDGTKLDSYSMLPSAAFYINAAAKGKDTVFVIKGGGFGHGTGMSQTGAGSMAGEGYKYKKILRHYFSGVKIESVFKARS